MLFSIHLYSVVFNSAKLGVKLRLVVAPCHRLAMYMCDACASCSPVLQSRDQIRDKVTQLMDALPEDSISGESLAFWPTYSAASPALLSLAMCC